MDRWVILDVGETLIDESRIWAIWADVLDIPRLTFMAVLGAAIARGGQDNRIFDEFGIDEPTWRARVPEVEERYGGFREQDLYPDARRAVDALVRLSYRVGLVANQPASRTAELRALGFHTEVIAMSDEMGVAKPDPAFFARVLELAGNPDPGDVAYAGDRVDNDVIPSAAAGMRAIWVRRGPWGMIQLAGAATPALVVDSLDELVERIGEAWPDSEG
jgi:HAD superfamily hydrolase (TIGR01549 family)